VVIDALGDLERAAGDPARFSDYIYALAQHLAARQVSTMFLLEAYSLGGEEVIELRGAVERATHLVDNLLALSMDLGGDLRRGVRILKSRGSAHDGRKRPLRIAPEGMVVGGGT
jgi:KaiC/GvpD/RAD55 family RecA-like ATPase